MKKKRVISMVVAASLGFSLLTGCSISSENLYASDTIEQGKWLTHLTTDKAAYKPGDKVTLNVSLDKEMEDGTLIVQYKHLHELVSEEELEIKNTNKISWEWTPEEDDFKGYMVEVYVKNGKEVVDHLNIAVDVSSDWSKFPRYGYLADFYEIEDAEQEKIIDKLNRFHVNGLQFYDWQYKHEQPVKLEDGKLAETWPDIANREVSKQTIEKYISLAHDKNMKAMNYNLLFGAYDNYEEEGVKREWGLFKDPLLENQDMHPLPDSWASDIYLMDPSNEEWQDFLIEAEKEVFEHFEFDGWHVDQLGDRGALWNGKGDRVELGQAYIPLLEKAKEKLGVDLVMNAVGQFAAANIATQAPVNFLYAELWDAHNKYSSLKDVIDQNTTFGQGKYNTVLAAYMNYDLSDSVGEFNTPAVLLTDAVIFASGGSHIELGENMLSKEYFPHKKLEITDELNEQLIRYYDFMVAYQNLLRDGLETTSKEVTSKDVEVTERAEQGKVWAFSKQKEHVDVVQLINFSDATTMEWRDDAGTQVEPKVKEDLEVTIETRGDVEKIWVASPDVYNGSAMELDFKQKDGQATVTIPSLKYWEMVVIEYKE
ncbi:glycoside hydrolase family 66 protein [Bacillus sp. JJ1566]|uniref:glycoside hydrolase family 66 protein n=1 Tax=Bacillus sp. JJ1566 TaxID=3122961 RepID=UPI002FFE70F7